jgi:ABC-type phosphate transport system substrate-binding protein
MRTIRLFAAAVMLSALAGARAEIVVIGNQAAGPLSKEQAADVFLGKATSRTPVDQPESAPIRAEFYKHLTGRTLAQVRSTWSRLVFSGNGQLPKEMPDAAAVKKAVAADPKTVGYIDKSAVDGSVKVLLSVE